MGVSLSTTIGFGIIVPWGEEDEYDFTQNEAFFRPFSGMDEPLDPDDEWYWHIDRYEAMEAVCAKFPGLTFDMASYYDYCGGIALFTEGSTQMYYGTGPYRVDNLLEHVQDYEQHDALIAAADFLDIGDPPGWIMLTSLG